MAGCRDCPACTAPAAWRSVRWTAYLISCVWMVKPFMSTCPRCHHLLGRHTNSEAF